MFPRILFATALLCFLAVTPLLAEVENDEQGIPVTIAIDRSGGSVRLILTHGSKLDYAIRRDGSRLEVLYNEPIETDEVRLRVGDPLLKRVVAKESSLWLVTGSEFARYESFELQNPFRLILDLSGARAKPEESIVAPRSRNPRTVIVIDPGHGGVEDGAVGPSGLKEKEVTLDLARRLRDRIERISDDVAVVLTRDEDRLVGLDERTAIANHNQAALFISLHLNAAQTSRASGAETYYLSTSAVDDEARALAARENRSLHRKFDPPEGRDLDLVLWDLAQNKHLAASSALAESIQEELNRLTGTRNRGVRQAPFRVLMGAMMPAVLVEVGFISNPREEQKFRGRAYRRDVAQSIANAVAEFLGKLRRTSRPSEGVSRRFP